jgi:hypothetical protein
MEEAPENGKESPHSAHTNGLIDWLYALIKELDKSQFLVGHNIA